jgi:hypothetical protein
VTTGIAGVVTLLYHRDQVRPVGQMQGSDQVGQVNLDPEMLKQNGLVNVVGVQ